MDKIFKIGFFVLIAVIILMIVFNGRSDSDQLYIDDLHNKVEALNDENSVLEAENTKIATDLALKMDSIATLEGEVAEIEYKKILLTRYYEKKIRNIDKLNVSQLDSVFAARYRFSGDTN